jgi:cytochrome c peroxidase
MKNSFKITAIVCVLLIYIGCKKAEIQTEEYAASPILPQTPYDYENTSNDHLVTLGRVLFYDKKMSLNNSVSCGSCHQQSKAFCDNKQFSSGLQDGLTRRNTPPVIVHSTSLFWDGRASDFTTLALMPLVNHIEMKNYDLAKLESKVSNISYYPALFIDAYGNDEVTISKIQQALAAFMTNFNFDQNKNLRVQQGLANFTAEEQIGENLFAGKARCGNCHNGPSFAGWGGSAECIGLDVEYADNGIGELTGVTGLGSIEENNGKFRIPHLLNIEFTAPYMHDGRFKTLEEVVEHYNSGIQAHPNLSWAFREFPGFENMSDLQLQLLLDLNHDGEITSDEIPPGTPAKLNLTELEKKCLVAYLKTLSDPNVFSDMRFSDPFRVN